MKLVKTTATIFIRENGEILRENRGNFAGMKLCYTKQDLSRFFMNNIFFDAVGVFLVFFCERISYRRKQNFSLNFIGDFFFVFRFFNFCFSFFFSL